MPHDPVLEEQVNSGPGIGGQVTDEPDRRTCAARHSQGQRQRLISFTEQIVCFGTQTFFVTKIKVSPAPVTTLHLPPIHKSLVIR